MMNKAVMNTERWFWIFALSHVVLWTAIPTWMSPNAPLDVIEGYAWGREWLWGTYKHPTMQAWCLEILATLTHRASWAHFLASQLAVLAAFWAIWRMGCTILDPQTALLGVLFCEGIYYYHFTSIEFNPNVLQIAFWPLMGYSFYQAIVQNTLKYWILLGIWSACGLYSKYSTALLLITFFILMLYHPIARVRFKEKGPYLSALVCLILFAPHINWLIQSDFLPLSYTQQRLHTMGTGSLFAAKFVLSQALALLPCIFLMLYLKRKYRGFSLEDKTFQSSHHILLKDKYVASFNSIFLSFVTFGPLFITCALSLFMDLKLKSMWGSPFWGFWGLWIGSYIKRPLISCRTFISIWIVFISLGLIAFMGTTVLEPYMVHKGKRIHFPGKDLVTQIESAWTKQIQKPLRYVIGDTWLAGNIGYYASTRPHVFIDQNTEISPWINEEDLRRSGGVYLWEEGKEDVEAIQKIKSTFPDFIVQKPLILPWKTGAVLSPVHIHWIIIPPQAVSS